MCLPKSFVKTAASPTLFLTFMQSQTPNEEMTPADNFDSTSTLGSFDGTVDRITSVPTTEDTFRQDVEAFLTFKIAEVITKYWFPIMVPIGLVGNSLSFLVMIKPSNRKLSTCIYMSAISVTDNAMMLLALHNWLLTVVGTHTWHLWECKSAGYFVLVSLQNSTFLVVAMTVDKYVAIKWPHRAATYSTPRRAKMVVLGVFAVTFIYNIPHLFASDLEGSQCLGFARGGDITKVYSWFSFVLNALVPLTMLVHMNYVIIQKVKKSHTKFSMERGKSTPDNRKANEGLGSENVGQKGHSKEERRRSVENQLTTMLLLVTTLFVVLMLPTYARFITFAFVPRGTPRRFAALQLFYHISHKLYHTNNAINFFLYCISGSRFRRDVRAILRCGDGDGEGGSGASSSTSVTRSRSQLSVTQDSNVA